MTTDTIRQGSPLRLSSTNIRDLALIELRRDGGTQSRVGNHEETVEEYADAMLDGRWLWHQGNALIVYGDDEGTYWLADGFHRIEAAARAGVPTVPCDVRPGSRRDAVLYAVGANSSHGLRRTRQDVRRAIETLLRDEEWRRWSNVEIARRVGCTDKTVAVVRSGLESTSEIPRLDTRRGADDKARAVPAAPSAPPAPAPAPAHPEPNPDPMNAPLTDDELGVLSFLGGFEESGKPDIISLQGTRQITLVNTRTSRWKPEMQSASGWRYELAALQDEARRKADLAEKAARANELQGRLSVRARAIGYEMTAHGQSFRFHKGGAPMGGAKTLEEAEEQISAWEEKARTSQADTSASVTPSLKLQNQQADHLKRHVDELLAGLMEKATATELRLIHALAMHSVDIGTDDEDVKADLWEYRFHFLHQLDADDLRWIEEGA